MDRYFFLLKGSNGTFLFMAEPLEKDLFFELLLFSKKKLHIIYIITSSRNLRLFIVNANHACLQTFLVSYIDKVCKPLSLSRRHLLNLLFSLNQRYFDSGYNLYSFKVQRKQKLFIRNTFYSCFTLSTNIAWIVKEPANAISP